VTAWRDLEAEAESGTDTRAGRPDGRPPTAVGERDRVATLLCVNAERSRRASPSLGAHEPKGHDMALDDWVDSEVVVAVAATAAALSPGFRRVLRRGAVYGVAGVLKATDVATAAARGAARGAGSGSESAGTHDGRAETPETAPGTTTA
jgi:hypothetical protein